MQRYLAGEGSPEEIAELEGWLRVDAEARKAFWQEVEWHSLFRQWGEEEWGKEAARAHARVTPIAMPQPRRPVARRVYQIPRKTKSACAPLVQAAAVLAIMATLAFGYWKTRPRVAIAVADVEEIATLELAVDVAWQSPGFTPGTRLKPGRLQIERGAIVVALDRGARVVVEGPADFEVTGDNAGVLRLGRARAHVPEPAHGFKLETPQFSAVDVGTEFGCEVAGNGTGELHVIEGRVELEAAAHRGEIESLVQNQARRIERGVATAVPAQPLAFLSEDELACRELRAKGDLLGAWRRQAKWIDQHPATVLHLDFEGATGSVMPNRARPALEGSDVRMFGGQAATGRWPGKGALGFPNDEARLEFGLPGQFESMTFFAWVKVEKIHEGINPLVIGRSRRAGEVHWYLYGNGALGFCVQSTDNPEGDWAISRSERVVRRENLGKWMFVATVFDGVSGTVMHYVNGEPVATSARTSRVPLQLGVADIGGRYAKNAEVPPPGLDGCLDELAILSTALGADDIARLYEQGKPEAR
ncbi:hypothetical protein llg_32860 [Luteolibacter sp. LG18]|nr:hypothetical protein llg_32860 [Luteolibacter sp. LG18]